MAEKDEISQEFKHISSYDNEVLETMNREFFVRVF